MARVTTQELYNIIIEQSKTLASIETTLTGHNGDNGLCGDVRRLRKDHDDLEKRQGMTSRIVYGVMACLGVTGITGIGVGLG